jgi:FixJ family two-component response regulator
MSGAGLVYVVDDDDSFRASVSRLLRVSGFNVRTYRGGAELLAEMPGGEGGCVLADLRMPRPDGLELQEAFLQRGLAMPFVFLTGQGDVPSAVAAMRLGAVDFLDKCAPREALIAAINRALERGASESAARARREELGQRIAVLTVREREVLQLVVRGRMNKHISAELGIHERTVKLHRTAITGKLGVRSVAELTALARDAGMLPQGNPARPDH